MLSPPPSSSGVYDEISSDDGCSICLEPFSSHNPPTVTECKHEYHLQCILEWTQRRKECPMCWQFLGLIDPASQELLDAVDTNRVREESQLNQVDHHLYESSIQEKIKQHLVAAANRARHLKRKMSSEIGSLEVPLSASVDNVLNAKNVDDRSDDGHSLSNLHLSQQPPGSPRRSSLPELLTFSESLRCKFSAASVRESISKGARGVKEKFQAHNNSVNELGREVKHGMNVSIVGLAKMIERLDLTSKQSGSSNSTQKGKGVEEDAKTRSFIGSRVEMSSNVSPFFPDIIPVHPEESFAKARDKS